MYFLHCKDNTERMVMQLIAREAKEIRDRDDLYRAQVQANQIAKLFKD